MRINSFFINMIVIEVLNIKQTDNEIINSEKNILKLT